MVENQIALVPDLIKSSSDAIQQNLPATAEQTDGALSTVVGFFNNVVLYPVKKANISFGYKLEAFEEDLREKVKDIPVEHMQTPSAMIAGPTLEALRYAYDEQELRDMFENLLASAMDKRKEKDVHPAFVEAIKQLSPLDAQVLNRIVDIKQLKCATITFSIKGSTQMYAHGMPNHFVAELSDLADPFLVSASLCNLERLGLIDITIRGLSDGDYASLKRHPYVEARIEVFKAFGEEFDVKLSKHALVTTNYGEQFARTCMGKRCE